MGYPAAVPETLMHPKRLPLLLIALWMSLPAGALHATEPKAPPAIAASYPPDGAGSTPVGHVAVEGLGQLSLFATRTGVRIVVTAVATGTEVARAESVVGLGETPIYVRSAGELHKIIISWNDSGKSAH